MQRKGYTQVTSLAIHGNDYNGRSAVHLLMLDWTGCFYLNPSTQSRDEVDKIVIHVIPNRIRPVFTEKARV